MTYKLNPILIMTDFLRSNLTDVSERITLEGNNSVNVSNSNIVGVTATGNISHIDNVQIDGVTSNKYVSWIYDLKTRNIIFREAVTGVVTYDVYTGTNFIYPGRPKNTLNDNSFPRVTIEKVSAIGNVLGNDKAEIVTNYRYQIKTYTRRDVLVEVDIYDGVTSNFEGQDLAEYINLRIYDVFDTYRYLLHPIFANYDLNLKEAFEGFDENINCYVTRQEFTILHIEDDYINIPEVVAVDNLLLQNEDIFELQNGDLLQI